MAERSRTPKVPNPFYVVLLLVSTAFVVTALCYLVAPWAMDRPRNASRSASHGLADWFDRRGPLALGVEFGLMFVSAVLAMATEHRFSPRRTSGPGPSGSTPTQV
jgi:hypothetical protein